MANTQRSIDDLLVIMADNTNGDISAQDMRDLIISLGNGRTKQDSSGWKDNVMPLSASGVPQVNKPLMADFGVSGSRQELAFTINDYCFIHALHVNHDIKINGDAYIHVHWSSNGTDVNPIKWEFEIMRALGHQQDAFGAPVTFTVEQTPQGIAWYHMIAEVSASDVMTLMEPDELILVTLKRVTNGVTENTDTIYGITVDIHYESDRDSTLNRAPDFYD